MKSNLIMGGGGDFIFKTFAIISLLLVVSVYTAPSKKEDFNFFFIYEMSNFLISKSKLTTD